MRKSLREFLTIDEVAKELRVNRRTVMRWIKSGKLPALQVGKNYRISKTDYQRFLSEQYIQPPPEEPTSL
jgi:excisionase family DNA binding protein